MTRVFVIRGLFWSLGLRKEMDIDFVVCEVVVSIVFFYFQRKIIVVWVLCECISLRVSKIIKVLNKNRKFWFFMRELFL